MLQKIVLTCFFRVPEADDLSPECDVGSLRCLINGLHELARTMDNLAYQVNSEQERVKNLN